MFQVSSTISKVSTMADHSLRLQVDINKELTPEENAMVFGIYNKPGYFIFKETEIAEQDLVDIPDEVTEFKGDITSSQRLRNRLFVYYKHQYGKEEGFEDWRKKTMLDIGQKYLDRIQE